jgi:hypothetical protein
MLIGDQRPSSEIRVSHRHQSKLFRVTVNVTPVHISAAAAGADEDDVNRFIHI